MASFTNLSFLSSIDVPVAHWVNSVAHWNNSVAHCVNLLAHCVNTTAQGVIVGEQAESPGGGVTIVTIVTLSFSESKTFLSIF